MRNIQLALILAVFSSLAVAQQPNSMTNTKQQPIYSSSPSISGTSEKSAKCTKLHAEIDKHKGKPQRRYAAAQRYKEECTNQN